MKIKKLHIKRFGGVKEKSLYFEEGFNELSFENEFGKSTCIEAIKSALYGFSPLKRYPYLPLTAETLDFDCEIDCSEDSAELGKMKIRRMHTGERSSGTLSLADSGRERAIRNKSFFSALEEANLPSIEELAPEFWMIDSESIEQERSFIQRTEAASLSLLDGIGYRGKSEAELVEELSEERKKIFTNHANSVSKIKKNEAELSELKKLISELSRAEEESKNEFQESLILVDQIETLEKKRAGIKEKIEQLEREREAEELRAAVRNSLREFEEKGYEKLEKTPHPRNFRDLIEEKDRALREREALEQALGAERKRDYDPKVKRLLSLKKDDEIARIFGLFSVLKRDAERYAELKAKVAEMATGFDEISPERCRQEYQNYKLLYAKWKNGGASGGNFGKKSLLFALTLLVSSAICFHVQRLLGLFPLLILGLFLILQYVRSAKQTEKEQASLRAFSVEAFPELGRLHRASKLIHSLREPGDEASDLIYRELENIADYQALRKERRRLRKDLENILEAEPEIRRLLPAEQKELESLILCYRKQELACRESLEKSVALQKALEKASEKEDRLDLKLKRTRILLLELWGTDEADLIEDIYSEAAVHRKRHRNLEAIAEEKKISLDNLLDEGYNFHKELEESKSELEEIERRLVEKKERSARLEERLSRPLMLSSPDYRGLSIEDLKDLSLEIRAENESLHYEYDILDWKIRIVRRSFEILRRRLKPSFVERAELYFASIAEDAKFSIDYGLEGRIVFQDKESAEYLDYSRLSTGAQAQVLLALKLSYLEETDPHHNYPLILDDALMSYDKKRKKSAVELLRKIAKDRQILYFRAE